MKLFRFLILVLALTHGSLKSGYTKDDNNNVPLEASPSYGTTELPVELKDFCDSCVKSFEKSNEEFDNKVKELKDKNLTQEEFFSIVANIIVRVPKLSTIEQLTVNDAKQNGVLEYKITKGERTITYYYKEVINDVVNQRLKALIDILSEKYSDGFQDFFLHKLDKKEKTILHKICELFDLGKLRLVLTFIDKGNAKELWSTEDLYNKTPMQCAIERSRNRYFASNPQEKLEELQINNFLDLLTNEVVIPYDLNNPTSLKERYKKLHKNYCNCTIL